MSKKSLLTDVQTLRKQARKNIDEGAVTSGYTADRKAVLKLLNNALATEIVCVLRYRRHYFMAKGIESKSIADEFAGIVFGKDTPKEVLHAKMSKYPSTGEIKG